MVAVFVNHWKPNTIGIQNRPLPFKFWTCLVFQSPTVFHWSKLWFLEIFFLLTYFKQVSPSRKSTFCMFDRLTFIDYLLVHRKNPQFGNKMTSCTLHFKIPVRVWLLLKNVLECCFGPLFVLVKLLAYLKRYERFYFYALLIARQDQLMVETSYPEPLY